MGIRGVGTNSSDSIEELMVISRLSEVKRGTPLMYRRS
jgi:hypothetical protein